MERQEHGGAAHDYVRHTIDCLEEAEAALCLALQRGQVDPEREAELARRIEELTRDVQQVDGPH